MNAQRCSLCFAFSSSTLRHFTLNPSPSLSCHLSQRHKHTLQWKCVCRAAERLSDLLSQPRVFACLWTSFSDTYSARGAWGVCSQCLGVCESWWGSDSCLMCVLSCQTTCTPAPPPSPTLPRQLSPQRFYLCADELWVRLVWKSYDVADDKITLEETLISTGDISNSITAWYPLLIMRNSLKLTLELLLESETIWVSFWSFKQRRWGDWHQVVTNRVEVYA